MENKPDVKPSSNYKKDEFGRVLCPKHSFPMYPIEDKFGCPRCSNEKNGWGFGADKNNGPKIFRNEDGYREEWKVNGLLHREDGPARFTQIWKNDCCIEEWFCEGKLHRVGGPACIKNSRVLRILIKEWWINDKRHREDGPAFIKFKDGEIIEQQWWENGERLKIFPL